MSVEFSKVWKPKALEKQQPVTQRVIWETASLSSAAKVVDNRNVIEKQSVSRGNAQSN